MRISIYCRTLILFAWVACFSGIILLHAAEPEPVTAETKKVLARMDQANQALSSLSADMKQTKVIVAIDDTSKDAGKLYFRKEKNGNKIKIEYQTNELKTILINEGKIQIYEPKINHLYSPSVGKNQAESEFFLVGFGSSDKLTQAYHAKFVKEEPVNGQKASLLELKPKASNAMFTRILLWVDQSRWLPAEIRLYEATGDHLTVLFENMKINPALSDKVFRIKK